MKQQLLISTFLIASFQLIAQSPNIEWQNTIGGSLIDAATAISKTTDGGYIIAGSSYSNISGDKTENAVGDIDFWIMKLNASGTLQWQNTIGGGDTDILTTLKQTTDGGYICGGYSNSIASGDKSENAIGMPGTGGTYYFDYWIVKLSASGTVQWNNTIGGNGDDLLFDINQTTDGGYIIAGESDSNISGDKTENLIGGGPAEDAWILKLDASGNIQWQNSIGGFDTDKANSIIQTTDGGYLFFGISESNVSGDITENTNGSEDYWVVKLSSSGSIQWQNMLGGNQLDQASKVIQTTDGGYLIAGYSESDISGDKTETNYGNPDYWVVKLSSTGNIQWQKTLGGTEWEILYAIIETADNGFILSGHSDSNISGNKTENSSGGYDFWIVKLNSSGAIIWQKTIGGSGDDIAPRLILANDNSVVLAGSSDSDISGDKTENSKGFNDYWVVKLSSEDLSTSKNAFVNLITYPNPTPKTTTIDLGRYYKSVTATIHNILGHKISSKTYVNTNKINTSLNGNTGLYFITVQTPEGDKQTLKIIKH